MTSKKTGIFLVLLLVSICINIIIYSYALHKSSASSIIGTYCTGTGISENDKYIVFSRDGSYTCYKQYKVLEVGKYETTDSTIYTLFSQENALERAVVYNGSNTVYVFDTEKHVASYDRISSLPTFINVTMRS
ncbi:hypothetical protein EDD70_2824 [Hydrogenoanaerobacterium saccharovorans]|uniref:Uncharacterized protein n=1 Tax=Hydrogenoanaerobacterium saccharovorans TaxID=474960 RepID=A0A1H8E0U8_9FIRM|nr:hypothetical protein [Hydrogenoanaerobacterium saccharovorans]RPF42081.1 hypothetical protein EDD70_2824 [Hydrogenoanaerobacterium saccharovorans]SEN13199.1 hypothetical protein SAMN05216180_2840 [Hydrogenoanaerobacterium saccharovorans]